MEADVCSPRVSCLMKGGGEYGVHAERMETIV